MSDSQFSRRNFLLTAGCSLAATSLVNTNSSAAEPPAKNSICVFTKPFT